jgi:predicted methyltransferase
MIDELADRGERSARWLRGVSALLALAVIGLLALTMRTSARDAGEARRLVEVLALRAGQSVADVGAGTGVFTVALAETVGPSGRVFATEIDAGRLADIKRTVDRAGLSNVTLIEATSRDSKLPEACCDAILLRRVYHHFTHPAETNATLFGALRPGGLLAVIDFGPGHNGAAPDGVPEDRGGHGMPRERLIDELASAGFHVERDEPTWSGRDYLVLFRRPE